MGYTGLYLKSLDGRKEYNKDGDQFAKKCRTYGMNLWTWAYVYDHHEETQILKAKAICEDWGAKGHILNSERPHWDGDDHDPQSLRDLIGLSTEHFCEVGISVARNPLNFPAYPWHVIQEFREYVVLMNQVYFNRSLNSGRIRTAKSGGSMALLCDDLKTTLGVYKHKHIKPSGIRGASMELSQTKNFRSVPDAYVADFMVHDLKVYRPRS